ncbi:ketosteroid isomerase [Chroococcidiopsis sp. CCALA 051]|nr:ketosteroid isomerase [Chroococcidiopsis sp. CCALA 051]
MRVAMLTNIEIIRSWYEAPNRDSVAPNAEWLITESFPAGGRYVGLPAIFEKFFPQLHSYFSEWESKVSEMLDAGNCIVALGHYSGRAKLTGTAFTCPFVHIWKLSNGKIVQFRQSADTLTIAQALSANATTP